MFNLTEEELKLLRNLDTPTKIQDFLNKIPINFEPGGDTCLSPREVLRQNTCHCIEGAILAALILRIHGHKPLLVDLESTDDDFAHVIAVFKEEGKWGALSKTNHAVLRYREPIYASIRELVMSFFHEYFDDHGNKNLRSFSNPIDLSRFDKKKWMTKKGEVWFIADALVRAKHYSLLSKKQIKSLRKADKIEIKVGKVVEWKKSDLLNKIKRARKESNLPEFL